MTPQELFDQAKNDIEADTQKSQQLQQELNTINLRIFANQQLVEKFKGVDGVETVEQNV